MAEQKCPVCGWKIDTPVAAPTPRGEVLVCCDQCAEEVRKAPDKFVEKP